MKNLIIVLFCSGLIFSACSGNSSKKESAEAENEIQKMDDVMEHGKISSKCGGHLDEFENLLAEYAGLTDKYLQSKELDETYLNDLEGRMETKLNELQNNKEMFYDSDCTAAFTNASLKFQQYVTKLTDARMNAEMQKLNQQ